MFGKHIGILKHPGYNGKSNAPPAPDYTAAANATAAGNLEAAKYTTQANRVNQVTPYGNLIYTQGGGGLNQAAYDQAMQNYNAQMNAYNKSLQAPNRGGGAIMNMANGNNWGNLATANRMAMPVAPNIKDYTTDNNQWTATQTLTPAQQRILEQQQGLSSGLLGAAQSGLDYAKGVIEKPGVDMSKLPSYGINPGETYSDAIMRRLQPTMQASQEAFDAKMANQGVVPGTQAYDNAYRNFSQGQNDLLTSAQVQGMNTGLSANQQAFNQQAYNQMQPINVINALRTGSQVQNPSYVNSAQMPNPGGADLLGAAQQGYNAQVNATNAQNAASGNFFGGLMNLGGAYLMGGR